MGQADKMSDHLAQHMDVVARALLGKPNGHSKGQQLRFGSNGSMSVDLENGIWHSHEDNTGGGVLSLIKRVKGLEGADAVKFMRDELRLNVPELPSKVVASYDYVDEHGELLFQVVRFEPKDFRQRRPNGASGWTWSVKGVRQVPYRLPELQEAVANEHTIVIVEGEKDADALAKWRIPATCNAGGAGKWPDALNEFLRDADVVIVPDNDPPVRNTDGTLRLNDGKPIFPGQDHAKSVGRKLGSIARSVRILELPGLPSKGDVSDWIAAGGTADEFWRLVETEAVPCDAYAGPTAADQGFLVEAPLVPAVPIEVTPFDTFDASAWDGVEIEPQCWTVKDRIPAGEPGIMSGDGGTGKSTLLAQLSVGVTAELPDWIGGIIETHGPVVFYSAEEKLKQFHRRVANILAQRGLSFSDLKGRLRFICDHDDVTLAKVERDDVRPCLSLLRLEKTVALIRPALIVIENAADVFIGNENDRGLVSRFVRKHLGGLAQPSNAAVALIQHPSLSGLADGSGRSGSTGWSNSGRWRLNFTKIRSGDEETDSGLRQLEVIKSNFGPIGEKVRVRWQRGVFVPDSGGSATERAAAEAPVNDAFMRCLDAATAQGRTVSDKPGRNYAPAIFEKMPEAGGIKNGAFELAMPRLFSAKRIKVETVGPKSRQKSQVVRMGPDDEK
jgi:RecA-family ATPase